MKIKLLSREIELIRVDDNAKELRTNLTGNAKLYKNKIYFDDINPFPILIHEILHLWLHRTANDNREDYTEEQVCYIYCRFTDQLMLENGDDIIKQLKEFANVY